MCFHQYYDPKPTTAEQIKDLRDFDAILIGPLSNPNTVSGKSDPALLEQLKAENLNLVPDFAILDKFSVEVDGLSAEFLLISTGHGESCDWERFEL